MKKLIALTLSALFLLGSIPAAFAEGEAASTDTPAVTDSTPAPADTATLLPEATATPTAAPTATPAATATPAPADTSVPTATPTAAPDSTATPTVASSESCVTMGADLTEKQRAAVYADFGIEQGTVTELTVTNAEERAYLEDLVPDRKIGSVALSCVYIKRLAEGAGLTITVHNINYCTEEMYQNALITAGIEDAEVIVSAPFPVSGTGALTGLYKAYEKMTGTSLNDLAKAVGAEELVVTGELSEYIGSEEASKLIAELKTMLDQTQSMSDGEVITEIGKLAEMYKISLTDAQKQQVLKLVRKLEGLSETELKDRLTSLAETAKTASAAGETVSKVYESVKGFFASLGSFFANIFGSKNA